MNEFVKLSSGEWLFEEREFRLGQVPHWESVFALANGYMGVRASLETSVGLGDPGFYVAGVFDRVHQHVHEIVNLPGWLGLGLWIEGFPFDLRKGTLLEYRRALDARQGLLYADIVWRDAANHTTRLETVRLVHQAERHAALIAGRLTPIDYTADVQVESTIDAWQVKYASPSGASRLQPPEVRDLGAAGIAMSAATRDSGIRVAIAAQLEVEGAGKRRYAADGERVRESCTVRAARGVPLAFAKRVCVWTSRDDAAPDARAAEGLAALAKRPATELITTHTQAWAQVWERADIQLEGDPAAQHALRFNVFHLSSLANPDDPGTSLGAKGLHGNGYSGLVFWDTEIFLLPFYIHTQPAAARALLQYRRRYLDDARANAKAEGHSGAFYPWNSSITGRENKWGKWQEHVGSDIAYGIDWYAKATDDREFARGEGAEVLLETARYWAGRVEWDAARQRHVIRQLTGPDEIHGGVDNNAFTNHLVRWHLRAAAALAADLRAAGRWAAVQGALDLTDDEIARWVSIADTMYDGFLPELGFHEQFEGHRLLPERAIDRGLSRMAYTGPVQHSFKPTKVAQQADTVLMYWMFFEDYAADVMRKGYEYYEPRCSHTSSLSRCIYSALAARLGLGEEAYRQFMLSAENDITPGKEMESESGVHAACMGGTWLAAVTGFAGVWVRSGRIEIDPHLPASWKSLRLTLAWRGSWLELTVLPDRVRLRTRGGTIPVAVRGREIAVTPAPVEVAL